VERWALNIPGNAARVTPVTPAAPVVDEDWGAFEAFSLDGTALDDLAIQEITFPEAELDPAGALSEETGLASGGDTPVVEADLFENWRACLPRFGDDEVFFRQMLEQFVGQLPAQLDAMQSALDTADGLALQRAGHTLKGAAANFNAHRLRAAAEALEKSAVPWQPQAIAESWAAVQAENTRLQTFYSEFQKQTIPGD
jgi:HPt (histidine-containing phosphotransfer) domain-containing protein